MRLIINVIKELVAALLFEELNFFLEFGLVYERVLLYVGRVGQVFSILDGVNLRP